MRKITKEAKRAFDCNESFSKSNTQVLVMGDITEMYLFGNKIARKFGNKITISLAGWNTNTTRERLNAFANVSSYKGQAFINGEPVDDSEWVQI